jgi:beta-xylosidase
VRESDAYYLVFTVRPFRGRDEKRLGDPDRGSSPGIKLYSSRDLRTWAFEKRLVRSSELPEDCPYKHRFWAPEIHKIGGKFYLIFAADNWIARSYNPAGSWGAAGYAFVGVADRITGPYEHVTYIAGGACDTSLFEDADGRTYAFIAAGDVFVQQIDLSRLGEGKVRLVGERRRCVTADNADVGLTARPEYLEGPWAVRRGGRYCLFHAGPYKDTSAAKGGYWAGVAYADSVLGPWKKDPRGRVFWGGHLAVCDGPDGRLWFCYRGEQQKETRGFLCIDPLISTARGWSGRSDRRSARLPQAQSRRAQPSGGPDGASTAACRLGSAGLSLAANGDGTLVGPPPRAP